MNQTAIQQRFQGLIVAHRGVLFKVCNSYCRNHDDREDLAQEIVVQLWRSFPSYDEKLRFSTWMYRVALNVAISAFRRERTRERHVISADVRLLDVADDATHSSPEVTRLYRMLEGLEPLQRALVLLYLDGYNHREIGEALGISEANVATRMSRIKQRLRNDTKENQHE